jgi:hypothetical protein
MIHGLSKSNKMRLKGVAHMLIATRKIMSLRTLLFSISLNFSASMRRMGIAMSVIHDPMKRPNIIVYASHAKNSSCLATDTSHKTVVIVVRIIG